MDIGSKVWRRLLTPVRLGETYIRGVCGCVSQWLDCPQWLGVPVAGLPPGWSVSPVSAPSPPQSLQVTQPSITYISRSHTEASAFLGKRLRYARE